MYVRFLWLDIGTNYSSGNQGCQLSEEKELSCPFNWLLFTWKVSAVHLHSLNLC